MSELDKIKAKIEALQGKKRELENREAQKKRRLDNRAKIILGSLIVRNEKMNEMMEQIINLEIEINGNTEKTKRNADLELALNYLREGR